MGKGEVIKKAIAKTCYYVQKYSPEILLGVGFVSGGTCLYFTGKGAVKAHNKLNARRETINDITNTISAIKNHADEKDIKELEQMKKKETFGEVKDVIVSFAPAFGTGLISGASILGSYGIIKKRNLGLAAAYYALQTSYEKYRERVSNRFGEEVENQIHNNMIVKEIEVDTDENGKKLKKPIKKTVVVENPDDCEEYTRYFDETNPNFTRDPDLNMTFLRNQERFLNGELNRKGFIFLNDVLDALGYPKTRAGSVVGWLLPEKGGAGDGYIKFGIYRPEVNENKTFVNGRCPYVTLNFNVDGLIWDKIPEPVKCNSAFYDTGMWSKIEE